MVRPVGGVELHALMLPRLAASVGRLRRHQSAGSKVRGGGVCRPTALLRLYRGIVHEMNVRRARGDVKPEAFMRDPPPLRKSCLSTSIWRATPRKKWLTGPTSCQVPTEWVLNDVLPATRREHGDLIGLASVLGVAACR